MMKLTSIMYLNDAFHLVKIGEFDHIWGSYGQQTSQKQPKMISSAGLKTLEHWKLGKYKSGTNETWPIYVPLQYLKLGC